MSKEVYIITYYWPPAGGPGVQRWLKFAKYLPKEGYKVTVVIPDRPDYPVIDTSLEAQVISDLSIIKVPINEPSRWSGKLSRKRTKSLQKGIIEKNDSSFIQNTLLWIRGNFFIPDARVGWVRKLFNALIDRIPDNENVTLITTGPPHSVHFAGQKLKKNLPNIQWIADFRDPWTTIGYHKQLKLGKRAAQKHLDLEKKILQAADKIIVTSSPTRAEFKSKTNKYIEVITNGYDVIPNDNDSQPDGKFSINHIGTLLTERNPTILWEVLNELSTEISGFSDDLEIGLAGNVSESIIQSIEYYNLTNSLNTYGYISHNQSYELMKDSQIVLLIEIDSEDTKAIIPGKLFEYLASRRPIISLGPKDTDVQQILLETNSGTHFLYHQKDDLKNQITEHYKAYQQNRNRANMNGNINSFKREVLTQKLAKFIEL